MEDLKTRIERLNPSQRLALAEASGCMDATRQKIVAYIAPRPGGEPIEVEELRRHLASQLPSHMLPGSIVVMDSLPRLPNGKIDTRTLKEMATASEPPVAIAAASDSGNTRPARSEKIMEQALTEIWLDVLGISDLRVDDNFFEMGGDSIMSIQIVARAREAGISITPRDLIANQTVGELAAVARFEKRAPPTEEEDDASGDVPLTPIQRWFFELGLETPQHWNQAILAEVASDADPKSLRVAIAAVIRHHDALRARFNKVDDRWEQLIPPAVASEAAPVEIMRPAVDMSEGDVSQVIAELHSGITLGGDAPLVRFVLVCDVLGKPRALVMIVHHLVIDNVSWQILLEDIVCAYAQAISAAEIVLPSKTTAYRRWAQHLTELAASETLRSELDYWTAPVRGKPACMPRDLQSDAILTEGNSQIVRSTFGANETTALLREANAAYNTRPHELLITALLQTLLEWAGGSVLRLGLEGFGREPVNVDDTLDLSRSVGWFTAFYKVTLNLEPGDAPEKAIKTIKEQLRRVPNSGTGYGALRYLSPDAEVVARLRAQPEEEVLFNYLGNLPAIDDAAPGLIRSIRPISTGSRAASNRRSHLLEINAYVEYGELQTMWTFNTQAHHRGTIEELSNRFIGKLSSLISHCLEAGSGGYTPSDFPDADFDQAGLDRFLDSIS